MSDLETALIQLQCELVAERNLVNPNGLSWLQYDILNLLRLKRPGLPFPIVRTAAHSPVKIFQGH